MNFHKCCDEPVYLFFLLYLKNIRKISYLIDFINSSGHMLEAMHKSVVSFLADFFKDLLSSFSPLSGILKFL